MIFSFKNSRLCLWPNPRRAALHGVGTTLTPNNSTPKERKHLFIALTSHGLQTSQIIFEATDYKLPRSFLKQRINSILPCQVVTVNIVTSCHITIGGRKQCSAISAKQFNECNATALSAILYNRILPSYGGVGRLLFVRCKATGRCPYFLLLTLQTIDALKMWQCLHLQQSFTFKVANGLSIKLANVATFIESSIVAWCRSMQTQFNSQMHSR